MCDRLPNRKGMSAEKNGRQTTGRGEPFDTWGSVLSLLILCSDKLCYQLEGAALVALHWYLQCMRHTAN